MLNSLVVNVQSAMHSSKSSLRGWHYLFTLLLACWGQALLTRGTKQLGKTDVELMMCLGFLHKEVARYRHPPRPKMPKSIQTRRSQQPRISH